nr:VapC toxin family PIN domain ribonuclease [Nocardioides ferulae]
MWVDHLRAGDLELAAMLDAGRVLMHPAVRGELALGTLADRTEVLHLLGQLPAATAATDSEVLALVEAAGLWGRGVGWVDAHLLASVRLTPHAGLWTRDRRLRTAADDCGVPVHQ